MREQLGKLLGISELEEEVKNEIKMVDIKLISPNPWQPRYVFNEEELAELSQSIKEHGIIQPLLVRQRGTAFHLIAGERRLRAAKMAGLSLVPVIVREIDDRETAILAMVENLQRKDLDFVEEARGYKRLLDEYELTQEGLARMVGKSQSAIANKLRLLQLPPEVLERIRHANLTERHARALLAVKERENLRKIVGHVINGKLNVAETEELIKEEQIPPKATFVTNKDEQREPGGARKETKEKDKHPTTAQRWKAYEQEIRKVAALMEAEGHKVDFRVIKGDEFLKISIECQKKSNGKNK